MLLLLLAVAPAAFLLLYLWLRDKYQREPLGLVLRVFLLGAVSAIPAFLIERYIALPVGGVLGYSGFSASVYTAFGVAALVEEAMKGLFTAWAVWRNPHFDEPMDGIVYFGAGALGFATLENVLYVLHGGVVTGIQRAILAVPGHAFFGIAMGYHLGHARFARSPAQRWRHGLLGVISPVLLHGLYDTVALNMNNPWIAVLMYPLVAYLWVHALRQIESTELETLAVDMPCGICGRPTAPDFRFCPYCGRPLVGPDQALSD